MKRLLRALCAAAVLGAGFLAYPGPASAQTIEEVANYTGPDRQAFLERGARKEGQLLWIGGLNERTAARPIVRAFMKKYPFIKAEFLRTSSEEALQRVLSEHRAGTLRIDLVNGNIVEELKEAKLVQAFQTPALAAYPKELHDADRMYATVRYSYHGVAAWNTQQTKDAEAPRTFEDLLHPRWKGKMIVSDSNSTGLPFLITYLRLAMGEEAAMAYLEKLAKQNVSISSASARNLTDMLIAGEYGVQLNPALHHIGQVREKGAPLDAGMHDPVLARNDYVLLLKGAPNPHAAMLMIDFVLSEEAQKILAEAEYYPAHPNVQATESMDQYRPFKRGMKLLTVDDKALAANAEKSAEIFKKLFR
jgi:ABC-type Fe3+ transport system substrate-binding protein